MLEEKRERKREIECVLKGDRGTKRVCERRTEKEKRKRERKEK